MFRLDDRRTQLPRSLLGEPESELRPVGHVFCAHRHYPCGSSATIWNFSAAAMAWLAWAKVQCGKYSLTMAGSPTSATTYRKTHRLRFCSGRRNSLQGINKGGWR